MSFYEDTSNYRTAEFKYDKWGERPMIPVHVRDANGQYQVVTMLLDSGNDTTLITMQDAERLGFKDTGQYAHIKGIADDVMQFYIMEDVKIRIGDTDPIDIRMVVGNTDMNLLGRRDVFDNFEVTFTPQGDIRLVQKQSCSFCI